jgi:hypothetical protein
MKSWTVCGLSAVTFVLVLIVAGPLVHAEDVASPIQSAPLTALQQTGDTSSAPTASQVTRPSDAVAQPLPPSTPLSAVGQGAILQVETGAPISGLASLAPPASEVALPDNVTLIAKPALIIHGKSDWEQAYKVIRAAVDRGTSEAKKSGLAITGYPLCLFVETSDSGFTYDVMLPLDSTLLSPPHSLPLDMCLGVTPQGKALRFTHLAAYDDIDGTYEQITAYLDAKDIVAKDAFIEEYLTFGETSAASTTTVNIFVQPKN